MTPSYQSVNFAASYIRAIKNQFLVFYVSVDNVLGRENVFGYRYSNDGKQRFEVKPVAYRTFLCGGVVEPWEIGQKAQGGEFGFLKIL